MIFNLFKKEKKKNKITLTLNQLFAGETPRMKKYRTDISNDFQEMLNKIDNIRYDEKLTPEERYGIMMALLYMTSKVSEDMITNGRFFSRDKELEKIHKKTSEELFRKENIPTYIG